MDPTMSSIFALAAQVAEREGLLVYDIEFATSHGGRTLRVMIDRSIGSVSVDDCERFSQGLSLLLDVEDVVPGSYSLEVSSPGLERPLKLPWHFERAVGHKIWVKTREPLRHYGVEERGVCNGKTWSVTLDACSPDTIEVQGVRIPFADIEKAHLIFEIVKGEKKSLHKR